MTITQISDFPISIEKSEIGNKKTEEKMTNQKQMNANRTNAQSSTGPKTANGKAIVAQNPLKHGIFSKQVLLEGESKKEFDALRVEFHEQFHPEGFLERLLCERALATAWRLARVTQMESMLIDHAVKQSFSSDGLIAVLGGYQGDELSLLSRYEISSEKILFRSLAELRVLQTARKFGQDSQIGFVPQNLDADFSSES